ncbi:MAG: RnfABCDGE type electron transport complex subunit D [Dehalococcoidia bacterium]
MTAMTMQTGIDLRRLKRGIRSPKGNLLLLFGALVAVAIVVQDSSRALPSVIYAVSAAAVADIIIQRIGRRMWVFPTAGILSGLIVAMVLSPYESAIVAPMAAILAITTKHLFRARLTNIFNPAALALVSVAVLFKSIESWWGATPDAGWSGVFLIGGLGWYTADRVNKLPMVLMFLGTFYLLATSTSFFSNSPEVASVFRSPDLHAALFFSFFMLDDPPTSPVKYRDQLFFGVLVGVTAFGALEIFGWLYYLLAGLLVGNAWWAAQRTYRDWKRRQAVRPPAPQVSWARPR